MSVADARDSTLAPVPTGRFVLFDRPPPEPDAATAERLARILVGERLAACVQVVPGEVSLPPVWILGSSGASAASALRGRLQTVSKR